MLIGRVRARDYALRDFLDLFHHRIISHYYQAWAKYHFPILYEAAVRTGRRRGSDRFTTGLFSLVGLGSPELSDRLDLRDETFLYYGGLFAHFPRNAISLERMLGEFFRVSVCLLQFQGQWLRLEEPDQTRLTTPRHGAGWNNTLGQTAVAGERIWGVENKFRLRLGPLSWEQFLRFSPLGKDLTRLAQFVRSYVGPDMDFEVQPVLRRNEVRPCRLGHELTAHLGWTTWVQSHTASSDVEDAVFTIAEDPRC
jgi:type VI secretion system protein ImpH